MAFVVMFAPEAEAQLLSLYRYIIAYEASPDIAQGYVGAIIEHCEALKNFPNRGSPRDDLRPGLRTLSFRRRVTIVYMVEAKRVTVLGIFYGGQDMATLLGGEE
jgi:toxin ParE1/3/4